MANNQIFLASGELLVLQVKHANNFFTRLLGLMGTKRLSSAHGLLITPCQQIHTHFMRYPVDVIFLDNEMIVLEKLTALKPWRFSRFIKKAKHVLELPENEADSVNIGDRLILR
jgi:uncharacterized membrane protein (UPF0127 family)